MVGLLATQVKTTRRAEPGTTEVTPIDSVPHQPNLDES
jgi:hypothetical protein